MYLYSLIACANLEKEWFVGYDVALCQVGRCMETRELLRSTRPRLAVSLVLEVVVQPAAEPTWAVLKYVA